MHLLGIVVPYRDRYEQLVKFKSKITKYLEKTDIDYRLIVVEQDNATSFNRGKLLNIGFEHACKLGCDYVVFHDVDMHPVRVDYSYADVPLHLSTGVIREGILEKLPFPHYFGGVTLFPIEDFKLINGYSNNYWGWGFEDDDLLYRCVKRHVPVDIMNVDNIGANIATLKFNGADSSVRIPNTITYIKDFTIHISIEPDELVLDHTKDNDRIVIFNVPGYDFTLYYNSFNRYVLEVFDDTKAITTITTQIQPVYKTNFSVTWDSISCIIGLYQNGVLVEKKQLKDKLIPYHKIKYLTLGCRTIEEDDSEYEHYKGLIDQFMVWDIMLPEKAIKSVAENTYFGFTHSFANYQNGSDLVIYYDAKMIKNYELVDLTGKNNPAKIYNCEIIGHNHQDSKQIRIPFRRNSTFSTVDTKVDNYLDGRWRHQTTRFNQLKYVNEVSKGLSDLTKDGLSTLDYKLHSTTSLDRETHMTVAI